jgi:hypothetical protein
MYLGAAVLLWLVRAWKIGDLEEKAAMARRGTVAEGIFGQDERNASAAGKVEKSAFIKRVFMWQRV